MGVRITAVAAIAVAVAFFLLRQTASVRQAQPTTVTTAQPASPPSPSAFSPRYSEALRSVVALEESDVTALEQQLAANPDNLTARLKLMAYHARRDRAGQPADQAKRFSHALWTIQHHPDAELLHSPYARFTRAELSPAGMKNAIDLWAAVAKAHPNSAAVQWNAASFFEDLDPELYLHYLETTAAADPGHPFAIRPLAHLYALSLLRGGPFAARSRVALDTSNNVWILGNAAYMLQSQYNVTVQNGSPNARAASLAEHYFRRAQALNPTLDRAKILPQIDRQAVTQARPEEQRNRDEWQAMFDEALGKISRLPVESFPQLPPAVATVLKARNCQIPQPFGEGGPRNVIRGEFFRKGESGWAVLCSSNNASSLLAFRNDADTTPDTVASKSEDRGYLQGIGGDQIGYSRQITPVGRDFILNHYRAYGGPEPPPIDHHGIDDAFLEKASVTWYFHQGKWIALQGAD